MPVLPSYIAGAPQAKTIAGTFVTPSKTHVAVGKPIDISEYYGREKDKDVLQELTTRFMREIAALAGLPDYEPKPAGRRWKPEIDE